jgi:hypothetical protein
LAASFLHRPFNRSAGKVIEHSFKKFPAQHADKAVRAAFKVGVAIGKKQSGSPEFNAPQAVGFASPLAGGKPVAGATTG